jgi:mRNA interferase YafQ
LEWNGWSVWSGISGQFAPEYAVQEVPLDPRLMDHALKGEFVGRRECHVEPDWLLVYKREPGIIIFERTGTHADLFE